MKVKHIIERILSIPKSLWVSLHYFPLAEALRLPVCVRYNVILKSLKGSVTVNSTPPHLGRLSVGFGDVGLYDKRYNRSVLEIYGKVVVNGKASLGTGSVLSVSSKGCVTFGNNFCNTANVQIVCGDRITFGDDVLVSWDTLVMDTDFHKVKNLKTDEVYEETGPIEIGDNVWIGCRAVVLKGSKIPNGCILGTDSVCTKPHETENCVIAGNPAAIRKTGVTRLNSKYTEKDIRWVL